MQSSLSFAMNLCLLCVLCSHRPRIIKLVVVCSHNFLLPCFRQALSSLFRVYFVYIFCVCHGTLLVPFIMLDSFTLLCCHQFN